MDVQMPEMDGLEATRQIHALWHGGGAELPAERRPHIIAMTANALQGDREICLAAGMDDYISKPVYLEELKGALERVRPVAGGPPLAESDGPAAGETAAGMDAAALNRLLAQPAGAAMLALYLEESAGLVAALEGAVAGGDAPAVRQAAHSIKGSSGYAGAREMVRLSAALEQKGRSGDLAGAADMLAALRLELERVRLTLAERGVTTP
jgi:CheY-like chemotaxis protein